MPRTSRRNKSWVCLVWPDGSLQLWNEPHRIRGVRHKGQRPLFAYGSKNVDIWIRLEIKKVLHPVKGKYIEVEPLIEEIIQDIVLPRVNFKLDTRDRKFEEDLKKYFRG